MQVTAEGGQDAAMEAPFIYAAIDALAARAMAWAERRQRMILASHPEDYSLLSPGEAASAASAAVKEVRAVKRFLPLCVFAWQDVADMRMLIVYNTHFLGNRWLVQRCTLLSSSTNRRRPRKQECRRRPHREMRCSGSSPLYSLPPSLPNVLAPASKG